MLRDIKAAARERESNSARMGNSIDQSTSVMRPLSTLWRVHAPNKFEFFFSSFEDLFVAFCAIELRERVKVVLSWTLEQNTRKGLVVLLVGRYSLDVIYHVGHVLADSEYAYGFGSFTCCNCARNSYTTPW